MCPLPGTRRKQPGCNLVTGTFVNASILLSLLCFLLLSSFLDLLFRLLPYFLSFSFSFTLCVSSSLFSSCFLFLFLFLFAHSHPRIHVVIRSDHFLRKHRARNIRAQAIEMTASISKFSETGSHLYLHLLLPPPPPFPHPQI